MKKKVKHICGQCGKSFASEASYLKHVCPALGKAPKAKGETPRPKVSSILEKRILAKVQSSRLAKKQYNA